MSRVPKNSSRTQLGTTYQFRFYYGKQLLLSSPEHSNPRNYRTNQLIWLCTSLDYVLSSGRRSTASLYTFKVECNTVEFDEVRHQYTGTIIISDHKIDRRGPTSFAIVKCTPSVQRFTIQRPTVWPNPEEDYNISPPQEDEDLSSTETRIHRFLEIISTESPSLKTRVEAIQYAFIQKRDKISRDKAASDSQNSESVLEFNTYTLDPFPGPVVGISTHIGSCEATPTAKIDTTSVVYGCNVSSKHSTYLNQLNLPSEDWINKVCSCESNCSGLCYGFQLRCRCTCFLTNQTLEVMICCLLDDYIFGIDKFKWYDTGQERYS